VAQKFFKLHAGVKKYHFGTFLGDWSQHEKLFEIMPPLAKNLSLIANVLCEIKSYGFQMKIFSRFSL
jgi:hypothetical protein